jgi:phosphoribosylformylglycinamidine synthase
MTVVPEISNPAAMLFGEDQGRMVVATSEPDRVRALASEAQLFSVSVGTVEGDALVFDLVGRGGEQRVTLANLRRAHEAFLPELMGADGALA